MGRNWTEEQKKVISLRNRNILVSAAAGSGKTAVLVERIIQKLTDSSNPVDIDRLLIMTFTRAAAGEMKERITNAIEEALYNDPDNENLQKQNALIHNAQITTIDGFCGYLIRNYFHLIDLDPGFRVADEGELKLLREDVMAEVLEKAYASGNEDILEFIECYASGKKDDEIREWILKVYDSAMSNPDPEQWLEECLLYYGTTDLENLRASKTIQLMWEAAEEELEEAERLLTEAKTICLQPGGPYLYEDALQQDELLITEARSYVKQRDYDEMHQFLNVLSFARLSTKKATDVEPELKEAVKNLREQMKEVLKEMGCRMFPGTEENLLRTIQISNKSMQALVSLVLDFKIQFTRKKQDKNLLDFTDMEHFALQILMQKQEDGSYRMSQAALELSEKYEEVMVDEYQDSNLIQELLTTSVSGWVNERKNIFMVGDVKQSIYRFRLARPELFMEKYHRYQTSDAAEQRIDLHKNFRSRPEVLSGINYIFRQIMGEDLGGISYDDDAALYPGAVFPEGDSKDFRSTEILLIEKDGEELEDQSEAGNAQELEALAIAHRIKEMVGKETVVDTRTGGYRPVTYGDIVVLLRTASGWAEQFSQVFESVGIPAYTASRTGYFSTLEISTILNYLRICDNPLQDIPMAGVLRSPLVDCTTQELSMIRRQTMQGSLYEGICSYLEDGQISLFPDEETERLKEKLHTFLNQLHFFREISLYTPIHELILRILNLTGYEHYAAALPGGAQRSANLNMLVEKAMDYEKTSYRGLFNFIRYIEKLQKYEVDFGEVNLMEAGNSAVRIMTIHKSKGLEFPIVFAAGMGKQFNFMDVNARLLVHPELGFGADAILPKERMIVSTVQKQMIRRQILRENLGEELRVLYVALTRAKEKLILSGTIGKMEKQIHMLSGIMPRTEERIPFGIRMKAKNYWSFVLPALARHRCMDKLYHAYGIGVDSPDFFHDHEAGFTVRLLTAEDLTEEEMKNQIESAIREERLKNWNPDMIYDAKIREMLKERFEFQYPYAYLKDIPVKVSVSELKKRSYPSEEEKEESLYFEHDIIPLIPKFVKKEEEVFTGAARGTAYHKVMECLDYNRVDQEEQIHEQIEELLDKQKLLQAEADSIRISDISNFVESPVGKRMKAAAKRHLLIREQPFVIAEKAELLDKKWCGGENVLIQGIIDAFFMEEDEIVLVDYKTDRIREGEEQHLIDLYHVQLEDYARALERTLQKKVKEAYLYSFTLGKEIRLF